jgi:hypothetical protein
MGSEKLLRTGTSARAHWRTCVLYSVLLIRSNHFRHCQVTLEDARRLLSGLVACQQVVPRCVIVGRAPTELSVLVPWRPNAGT